VARSRCPRGPASGYHANIARWRRDQALCRTAWHRPDLLDRLDPEALDERARMVLAELGWRDERSGR